MSNDGEIVLKEVCWQCKRHRDDCRCPPSDGYGNVLERTRAAQLEKKARTK